MVDFDIDKICRVCLQTNPELSLLFDEQNAVNGVCISDMISECTIYTVRRHDEFPHLICTDCMERVRSAYCFKKQFEASHRTLIAFLESINKAIVDRKPKIANDKSIQTEESMMYPCEKCDEKFLSYERLREHRSVTHRGTANLCRICLKTFNRIADLKNHIAVCHPEFGHITPNECNICSKKFTRKDHVNRHMRSVHKLGGDLVDEEEEKDSVEMKREVNENETLVETEVEYQNLTNQEADTENYDRSPGDCEDNASSKGDFEAMDPFSSDEDEKPLSVLRSPKNVIIKVADPKNILVKQEPNDESVQNLSIVLNSEKPNSIKTEPITSEPSHESLSRRYKCSECDKYFSRKSHVKRHLLSHRQEKPFPCNVCEKRFARADHLKIHLTKHDEDKPFQCDSCDRSFGRSDLLKRHKEQKHNGERYSRSESCEHCNKSFSSKNYLRKHLLLHIDKNWKCKWCSSQFESRESLKEHSKTHNKDKPYLCSECGLRFIRNDYLLIHMRRHNGEKPYKCKYCDKGFPRATDLKVHERYHTGEKTHLCTTCGKGFQRAYNLVVHMRVHTGERPYKCPHCPKNFAQCNDLKAHVRRHTGERFKCEICGTGFIQGYNLTQHKFVAHGIEVESRIRRVTKVSAKDLTQKASPDVIGDVGMQIKLEPASNVS